MSSNIEEFINRVQNIFERARSENRKLYTVELRRILDLADEYHIAVVTLPGDLIDGNLCGENFEIKLPFDFDS